MNTPLPLWLFLYLSLYPFPFDFVTQNFVNSRSHLPRTRTTLYLSYFVRRLKKVCPCYLDLLTIWLRVVSNQLTTRNPRRLRPCGEQGRVGNVSSNVSGTGSFLQMSVRPRPSTFSSFDFTSPSALFRFDSRCKRCWGKISYIVYIRVNSLDKV